MALIGLAEAAWLSGRNRATIHRAMKSGKLAFTLAEGEGERKIDISELERVFGTRATIGNGNAAAITVVHENSNRFAADIMPVIEAIRADGVTSLYGIARELNYRGIKTMRGGIWHPTTVKLLLARAA